MSILKANCGGLVLDNSTLHQVDGVITLAENKTVGNAFVANCGGVQFDSAGFKKVKNTVTDINAQESKITPVTVGVMGCGGLVVDSTYFDITNKNGLAYKKPEDSNEEETEETME